MPVVIVGLGIVLRFGVAYALRWLWIVTVGAVLGWLAAKFVNVHVSKLRPLAGVGHGLLAVNRQIENVLDLQTLAAEAAATALFLAVGHQLERAGAELAGFAVAVVASVTGVVVTLPGKIADGAKAWASAAAVAVIAGTVRKLTVAVHGIGRRVGTLERAWHTQLARLARGIDRVRTTVTRTIPREIGGVRSRVGRLERRVASRSWWRQHVRAIAGTAFFAAAVGTALRRLGLAWLRCGNVKKAGKAVCGMNGGVLDDLLLGVVALGISFNLVEFAKDVQAVTDESVTIIRRIVT